MDLLEPALLDQVPDFRRRLEWFLEHRPELAKVRRLMETRGQQAHRLLAIPTPASGWSAS